MEACGKNDFFGRLNNINISPDNTGIHMADSWSKKEREKKKQQQKKEKEERKKEKKEQPRTSNLEDMMAYIDENGNLSSAPPDPAKVKSVNAEDIQVGVPKKKPLDPSELIRKGRVTFFNHAKGYGFIQDEITQESIFVHVNDLTEKIDENNTVSFEIANGPKGANAVHVKLIR